MRRCEGARGRSAASCHSSMKQAEVVLEHAREGLEAMVRGHFERFAPLVLAHLEQAPDIEVEFETIRKTLPQRMRRGEVERREFLES